MPKAILWDIFFWISKSPCFDFCRNFSKDVEIPNILWEVKEQAIAERPQVRRMPSLICRSEWRLPGERLGEAIKNRLGLNLKSSFKLFSLLLHCTQYIEKTAEYIYIIICCIYVIIYHISPLLNWQFLKDRNHVLFSSISIVSGTMPDTQ